MPDSTEQREPAQPRRGRRARQLTPEELAEQEKRRRDLEAAGVIVPEAPADGEGGDQAGSAGAGETAADGGAGSGDAQEAASASDAHDGESEVVSGETVVTETESAPADPAEQPVTDSASEASQRTAPDAAPTPQAEEPQTEMSQLPVDPRPTVRRSGRRARVVELDERGAGGPSDDTVTRDADGVELGELSAQDRPDPRPAPRFDGRVLSSRPDGRRPLVWVVWGIVVLAIIAVVILFATGVLGGGTATAIGAASMVFLGPAHAFTSTTDHSDDPKEVDPA